MAATVTRVASQAANTSIGNKYMFVGTITGDTSYPTGGYSIAASAFGLSAMDHQIITSASQGGWLGVIRSTSTTINLVLQLFNPTNTTPSVGAGTEVVNATNVSTAVFNVVVIGT